jgi:maltose alpha-D-glucosyltransferase/alpha-amylase
MIDLWYKNAVIYCVDVETFMDSNGDGVGDFAGLAHRLDHIEALGATCLWLLPFYATPNRDNGYDVKDYYSVDPRLGTFGDFVEFTRAARDRGLRIIIDLVVNHTSIDHPWFQEARDPASPRRDWYVWSKEKPKDLHEGMVFPGVQEATWTWDEKAGAWYMHRFFKHQADLNIANPAVREEIERIMGFWLQLGATGFRLDAVPFLLMEQSRSCPIRAARRRRAPAQLPVVETARSSSRRWRRGGGYLLARRTSRCREVGRVLRRSGARLQHDLQLPAEPAQLPRAWCRGSRAICLRNEEDTKLPADRACGPSCATNDGWTGEGERCERASVRMLPGRENASSAAASDRRCRECSVATVGGSRHGAQLMFALARSRRYLYG